MKLIPRFEHLLSEVEIDTANISDDEHLRWRQGSVAIARACSIVKLGRNAYTNLKVNYLTFPDHPC